VSLRLSVVLALIAGAASAQPYPARQVTLIVPTTVGTAADITARHFAP